MYSASIQLRRICCGGCRGEENLWFSCKFQIFYFGSAVSAPTRKLLRNAFENHWFSGKHCSLYVYAVLTSDQKATLIEPENSLTLKLVQNYAKFNHTVCLEDCRKWSTMRAAVSPSLVLVSRLVWRYLGGAHFEFCPVCPLSWVRSFVRSWTDLVPPSECWF